MAGLPRGHALGPAQHGHGQEAFQADSGRFAAELPGELYRASTGVTVVIVEASGSAWRASATHQEERHRPLPQESVISRVAGPGR